jgi:RNA polymerase sigma-70 factor (ECF subfamily)
MPTDNETIVRIREGDKKEFESLFRSLYTSLVRYAKTMVKDMDTSEEIVQDLFVKLWMERDKINIASSLNGYLFRATHNKCIHYLEHKKVMDKYIKEISISNNRAPEDPFEILNYAELQSKIAAVLEKLPEQCGKVFCMNRFEGMKYREISETLSISVKTVEANMGKALKKFRKELTLL